jgi:hypothetical protein
MTESDSGNTAFYEKERKGILIHSALLAGSPFQPGDRFSIRPRPSELFSLTIVRDDHGEIFCDRHGIFIERTRRVDILLGGIFDRYAITIAPEEPGTIRLRPLNIVQDRSRKWCCPGFAPNTAPAAALDACPC